MPGGGRPANAWVFLSSGVGESARGRLASASLLTERLLSFPQKVPGVSPSAAQAALDLAWARLAAKITPAALKGAAPVEGVAPGPRLFGGTDGNYINI